MDDNNSSTRNEIARKLGMPVDQLERAELEHQQQLQELESRTLSTSEREYIYKHLGTSPEKLRKVQ